MLLYEQQLTRSTAHVYRAGKMIAPVYEQLSRDFPDVRFYKVDIDKDQVSSSVAASNVSAVVRPCCEARQRKFGLLSARSGDVRDPR